MDHDLETMNRDQLVAEVKKLRQGIRRHRDSTGHDLCWHHPDLWELLPERTDPAIAIPPWPKFMRGCIRYRSRHPPRQFTTRNSANSGSSF